VSGSDWIEGTGERERKLSKEDLRLRLESDMLESLLWFYKILLSAVNNGAWKWIMSSVFLGAAGIHNSNYLYSSTDLAMI